ncbi:MAG: type IX secretion system membrane protein PorP/SprF [Flavobacteriales bacterium]|nr:type IX secretion system membrane protein PorP/SprF [Flavobacteriales bacterium]
MRFRSFVFQFGAKFGMDLFRSRLQDLETTDEDDPFVLNAHTSFSQFNAGAGGYLFNKQWYFGLSIPRFLLHEGGVRETKSGAFPDVHFSAGQATNLGNSLRIRTASMLVVRSNQLVLLDLNASSLLGGKIWMGLHSGTGLSGMYFHYIIQPGILLGYGYDTSLRSNTTHLGSTHEITFRFDKISQRRRVMSFHM